MAMQRIVGAVPAVGVGRSSRFGKLFREKTGLSPRGYRGKRRNADNEAKQRTQHIKAPLPPDLKSDGGGSVISLES